MLSPRSPKTAKQNSSPWRRFWKSREALLREIFLLQVTLSQIAGQAGGRPAVAPDTLRKRIQECRSSLESYQEELSGLLSKERSRTEKTASRSKGLLRFPVPEVFEARIQRAIQQGKLKFLGARWRVGQARSDDLTSWETTPQSSGKIPRLILALVGVFMGVSLLTLLTVSRQKSNSRVGPDVAAEERLQASAEAEKALLGFLRADGWEAKQAFVRDPAADLATLQDWSAQSEAQVTSVLEFQKTSLRAPYFYFQIGDPLSEEVLRIPVVATDLGPKVDVAAYLGHNSPSLEEYLAAPEYWPDGVALRVLATPGNYFNYEFLESEEWFCLRFEMASGDAAGFAYAMKDSAAAKAVKSAQLEKVMEDMKQRMILRLRVTPGLPERPGPLQLEIVEFLRLGWVL
ncbi:MAG: hypothetical protein AAF555_05135 [Verrucomicrobiota bacterium]